MHGRGPESWPYTSKMHIRRGAVSMGSQEGPRRRKHGHQDTTEGVQEVEKTGHALRRRGGSQGELRERRRRGARAGKIGRAMSFLCVTGQGKVGRGKAHGL